MHCGDGDHINDTKKEKQTLLKKFDIPIECLSYEYIGECKKPKELEYIVRILRSGEEGVYPHLTNFAEQRLMLIKPESTLLRLIKPVLIKNELELQERKELEANINVWMQEMKLCDRDLVDEKTQSIGQCLSQSSIRMTKQSFLKSSVNTNRNKEKRISACDYAGWDKYDADTELNRIDLIEEKEKIAIKKFQEQQKVDRMKTRKKLIIEKLLFTETELNVMATREREKGNEAFCARDYEEALELYNTSIALDSDINTYNNRAITYIKLKNYEKAIKDCNSVLTIDCMNLKALLRRGLANECLHKNIEALKDYEVVIKIDPMNNIALSSIIKLRESLESKTARLMIEEIHDDN